MSEQLTSHIRMVFYFEKPMRLTREEASTLSVKDLDLDFYVDWLRFSFSE